MGPNTRCGYDVLGMILLQAYSYTSSSLEGVKFRYSLDPASYPMGTRGSFPGGKAAGA